MDGSIPLNESISFQPEKIYLLGEGNDHLVVALRQTNEVLRIRKTLIGASTCRKELLSRAVGDLEFLQLIVNPLLGPLITDSHARLVILTEEQQSIIMSIVSKCRKSSRLDKSINPYGISILCSNACTAFTKRSLLVNHAVSSTEPLQESTTLNAYNIDGSIKHLTQNGDNIQSISNVGYNVEKVHSRNVESVDKTHGDNSVKLNSNSFFHNSPCWSKGKLEVSFNKELCSKPRTICIELKPKQCFLESTESGEHLCKFCLKQYMKVQSGKEEDLSHFCPLDLFSGNISRMQQSMIELFDQPKTNLRIFQDGMMIDKYKDNFYLIDVILAAITYDMVNATLSVFSSDAIKLVAPMSRKMDVFQGAENSKLNGVEASLNWESNGTFGPSSVLGKLMCLENLDNIGIIGAANIYQSLVTNIGCCQKLNDKLQDIKLWEVNLKLINERLNYITNKYSQFTQTLQTGEFQLNSEVSFSDYLRNNKLIVNQEENCDRYMNCKYNLFKMIEEDCKISLVNNQHNYDDCVKFSNKEKIKSHLIDDIQSNSENNKNNSLIEMPNCEYRVDELMTELQNYLMAMTLKDTSVMILLQGPYTCPLEDPSIPGKSPFWFPVETHGWYKSQITFVDLIAKPPKKIPEHRKMLSTLASIFEDLQQKGKLPKCCHL